MAVKVDEMYVEATLRADKLEAGLKATNKKVDDAMRRIQTSLDKTDASFAKLGATIGGKFGNQLRGLIPAVTIASLAAFTKGAIDAVDAINDMSKKTGIAVETLQGLQYVAKLSGTDIETFTGALGKMNKNIGEAAAGSKTAQQAFAQLGIDLKVLQANSPEQSFFLIAERISQLGTEAERTKARMDIFGKSGNELAAAMEDGAAGMKTLMDQARNMGLIFSKEQVDRLAEFNDRWDTMTSKLRSVAVDGFLKMAEMADVASDRVNTLLGRMNKVSAFGLAERKTKLTAEIARTERDIQSSQANPILRNLAPGVVEREKEALRQLQIELLNVDYNLQKANVTEKEAAALKEKLEAATKKYTRTLSENGETAARAGKQAADAEAEFNRVLFEVSQRAEDERVKEIEKRMKAMADAAEKHAEAMAKPFEHAFENVQDALADMLVEGEFSFRSLADIAKRLAAEVAAAWVIRPVMSGVMGAVTGGGSSGGFSGSGLLGNAATSAAGNLLGGSSLFAGFNAAGAAALPSLFAPALTAAEAGFLTTAGVSGASAGSGAGILSGLGLNPATAAIAVAALVLPKLLKSFGGTPDPASTFGGNIAAGGALKVGFDSKHMSTEAAQKLAEQVQAVTASLFQAGIDVMGTEIHGGIDDDRFGGGFFGVGGLDKLIKFDPNSEDSLNHALSELAVELSKTADITNDRLKKALENLQIEGRQAADVLQELVDAGTFDARQKAFRSGLEDEILRLSDPAAYQRKVINAQADELIKQALGLEVDPALIERWRDIQLAQIEGGEAFKEASVAITEAMELAERTAEQWGELQGRLQNTIDSLKLGSLSALSPEQQYVAARQNLDDLAYRALGRNDQAAFALLPDAVSSFLEESRGLNASNSQYKTDFTYGQNLLNAAMQQSGSNAAAAREQLHSLRGQLYSLPANDNSGASGAAQVSLLRSIANALEQNNKIMRNLAVDNAVGAR